MPCVGTSGSKHPQCDVLQCPARSTCKSRGEKAKRKGEEKKELVGDGLPQLLSGDEFYERVVEFEWEQKKAAADKQTRKADRERRAEELATWKWLEDQRKNENKVQ